MKKGAIWIVSTCLIVSSLVLASCSSSTTTSTRTTVSTVASTTTSILPTTTSAVSTTKPTTTTTSVAGNWWDKLGKPQYGGTATLRLAADIVNFDPIYAETLVTIESAWMEELHANDWTTDPAVYDYKATYRPSDYVKAFLGTSWEFTDANTYVVHLRQGIHWQDISPVNGREFTADDVVYHYGRLHGGGAGFTKPSTYWATVAAWLDLTSITATDKYTVVFKWKTPNPESITETLQSTSTGGCIEAKEAVQQWGDLSDWHHAIGTGPFILKDFVGGSSATCVKNPNYWGYDERYPQNKLPYIDTLKFLIIPDDATALAALRTGKITVMDQISRQNAQSMQKTNPDILQVLVPFGATGSIDPRMDVTPFSDIRVRKAMQLSLDLPTIANTYYGGTASPYPAALTANSMTGMGWPYDLWPQDLKNEYSYNPTAAKQLLSDAGYPTGFKTNVVAQTTSDMDLLQIVKSYFAAIGIDMSIKTMDPPAWNAFVLVGRKYDQLATRPTGSLGLQYEPIRQLTKFQTGTGFNYSMVSDPAFDAFYAQATAATSLDQVKQALRDANEYVARHHWAISLLQANLFALYQPWLKGYNGQGCTVAIVAGPQFLFFYWSRFWIDQSLAKSSGQ